MHSRLLIRISRLLQCEHVFNGCTTMTYHIHHRYVYSVRYVQDHDDFPPMKLLEREVNPSTPYYIRRLFASPDEKHRICGVFTTIPRW